MRILSIHNTYQIRGGEDESRESEERLLREMGHEVDAYEESNHSVAGMNSLQLALRAIWSSPSYREVRQRLQRSPKDIVHVQNFFPLISPSVHYAARAEGVPVVQTLRNYRLLCPNGLFFRQGQVCEDCVGKFVPFPGVVHACYRENRAATGATAAMLTVHRTLGTWLKQVTLFVTLSQFARNKFVEAGFPAEKIVVKPNFVYPDPGEGEGKGGYALFVGRLSTEKGLDTLLEAWRSLGDRLPLKIIGDGPLSDRVAEATQQMPGVEWLGRQPMDEVHRYMGEASLLVFCSKWYETFGRVAAEAFAKGTPVIASNIGAIAELVDPGRTGLLFEPGNPEDLATKVTWALDRPKELLLMRQEARSEYERRYTAEQNYHMLIDIYEKARSMN